MVSEPQGRGSVVSGARAWSGLSLRLRGSLGPWLLHPWLPVAQCTEPSLLGVPWRPLAPLGTTKEVLGTKDFLIHRISWDLGFPRILFRFLDLDLIWI